VINLSHNIGLCDNSTVQTTKISLKYPVESIKARVHLYSVAEEGTEEGGGAGAGAVAGAVA
jgi:hypothetical protein